MKFADPYDFQRAVRAATVEAVVTKSGAYSAELTRTDLHQLWMQRGRMSLPHVNRSALHNDRRAVFFPTQGTMHHSGMEISPGDIVFLSSGAEHHHRTPAGFSWGAMSLTPDALAAAGETFAGYELTAPSRTRVIRPPVHLLQRLLHLHEAAGHLATTAPDILTHTEVAKAMEQELVRAMIACLSVGMIVQTYNFGYQRVPVMVRFEQLLEANQGKSLYVAEICAAIGVSDRTLRAHCQEHLGMSPHRYLWLRRMHLARRKLALADPATTTVTVIANDLGFGELGRFAVLYRKLFGEAPSATLRRAHDLRMPQADVSSNLPILP